MEQIEKLCPCVFGLGSATLSAELSCELSLFDNAAFEIRNQFAVPLSVRTHD
jgi:hypothetical protein